MINVRYNQCPLVGFPSRSTLFEPAVPSRDCFYFQCPSYVYIGLHTYAREGRFFSSITQRIIEPVYFMEGAPNSHPVSLLLDHNISGFQQYITHAVANEKAFWFFGEYNFLKWANNILNGSPDDLYILQESEAEELFFVELSFFPSTVSGINRILPKVRLVEPENCHCNN